MLDIKYIRENAEKVKEGLASKNFDASLVEKLLSLDEEKRKLQTEVEQLRARRNEAARNKNIEEGKKIKQELSVSEPKLSEIDGAMSSLLDVIPNIPADDVPKGKDETENVVTRTWGEPRKFTFRPKDHLELGEKLGIIDVNSAAQISGTRFGYLKGDAVLMQFALVQFVLETLTNELVIADIAGKIGVSKKTFIPVVPPVFIKSEVMKKMGRFNPIDERYFFEKDDILLIGSAEHTLGPLHMNSVLNEKDLPIRYLGYSTAFRREAGSYGKDTRGIFRVHQFDKLEIESFTAPGDGPKEQEFMVAIQEHLMQKLGIPYQVISICTGDMGGPDYRQIDINAWLPGQDKYRELHTSDYMTDYQSRRLNTKVKTKNGTEYVHMNDATAFAIGRTIIAILENYQNEDGTVNVPEVLRKWMGKEIIGK